MRLTPTPDDLAYFAQSNPDESVRNRILVERAIVRKAVADILAAGHTISVFDGKVFALRYSREPEAIMATIMSTDQDTLIVRGYPADDVSIAPLETKRPYKGSIDLIYGNDGWDVIADTSLSLEPLLEGATKLAEELQGNEQPSPASPTQLQESRGTHQVPGEVEIDDDAQVSQAAGGYWIQAWLWMGE